MPRHSFVVCLSIDSAKVHLAFHLSKPFPLVIRQIPRKNRYTPSATEISLTRAHYTEVLHFHLHPSHIMVFHIGHHGCLPPIVRVLSLSPEAFPPSLGGHMCPPVGHTCPPRLLLSTAFILPDDPFILPTESFIPFPLPYLSQPWCVKGEGGNAKPRCNARARVDAIYGAPSSADRRDCLGDETTPFRPHCKSPMHCGDWETKRNLLSQTMFFSIKLENPFRIVWPIPPYSPYLHSEQPAALRHAGK